jgi:lysophospholipase L1-like esterase
MSNGIGAAGGQRRDSFMKSSTTGGSGQRSSGRLLIVGDSISLGAAEIRGNEVLRHVEESFVQILSNQFPGMSICVDADVHRTSSQARELLVELLVQHEPDAVLLMVGPNDADLDWRRFILSEGKIARSRVPVERYSENIRLMVNQIRATGARPILSDCSITCVKMRAVYLSKLANRDLTTMIESGGGQTEADRWHAIYTDAIVDIAEEMELDLVRIAPALKEHGAPAIVTEDGAHMNEAGHRVIADVLAPILRRAVRTRATAAVKLPA